MKTKLVVVFVHGWSVTDTDTYGGLPGRLRNEAKANGMELQIEEIYLGRYISFHNEVRVEDIARAFQTAVEEQLSGFVDKGIRFACITHSTGGPVIREWWHRYYENVPGHGICPMSHLVMLAPANYGSALAQLGKGRLSRLKFWFGGVEPGQGVLDWLELGSREGCKLNKEWILSDGSQIGPKGVFPFVLTGQSIDRAFYDNLNTYTGELGSDGVVRVAAANLFGRYIRLEQEQPRPVVGDDGSYVAGLLEVAEYKEAPPTALRVISGKSHSGDDKGIMRSVKEDLKDASGSETVGAILSCLQVKENPEYVALCKKFADETTEVQKKELLEIETTFLRSRNYFIHDRFSMVVFRVFDDKGYPVIDYDLTLTAGKDADPNHLPRGFFADRQRNHINPETITYLFNYNVMVGTEKIKDGNKLVRDKIASADMLGFRIEARPDKGFVHYLPCEIKASSDLLEKALTPNGTTLVDICLRRVVRKNTFLIDTQKNSPGDFKGTEPGTKIVP